MFKLIFLNILLIVKSGSENLTDLREPQPLILNEDGKHILKPNLNYKTIQIKNNQKFLLSCPGSVLTLDTEDTITDLSENEQVICTDGYFQIQHYITVLSNIICSKYPVITAKYGKKPCEENNKEINIGFQVNNTFVQQIKICFDEKLKRTLYSTFELGPSIKGHQKRFPRPKWIEGEFYNISQLTVNYLYTQKKQKQTINKLLGLDQNSSKYLDPEEGLYLARGHLSAKGDFVFGNQQRTTFYFINAAPQWQSFNDGNWVRLENDVRNLSVRRKIGLKIFTGTYGILNLPHEDTEEEIEVFLLKDEEEEMIPVPLLYWKIVYEPKSKSGVVFIGVNNPFLEDLSEAIICDDVSYKIKWKTWRKINSKYGYLYACTVEDFRKKVKYFPKLDVESLLV